MPSAKNQPQDRAPTRRAVLELARVLVIPPGVDEEKVKEAAGLLRAPPEARRAAEIGDAWIVRDEQEGTSLAAIERYAGKPGFADAKVGTFKSVPLRSWRGVVRHVQPALPKIERTIIDED